MREEALIRRIGLIFLVLTFFVQFFAVLSPPQSTIAASNNDLINGGISSAADAKQHCLNNTQHYHNIMTFYGIHCNEIGAASTVTLRSNADNGQLFSMGRLPYGAHNPNSGRRTGEAPVNIPGLGRVYVRHLDSFDTGAFSSYQALRFHSAQTNRTYYILYNCGNLVSVGIPTPYSPPLPPPPPPVQKPTPPPVPKPVPTPTPTPVTPTTPTPTPTPTPKPPTPTPCQYNNLIAASDTACKPCEASQSSQDSLACVTVHKTAANTTAGIPDANNTTANPGNVIVYTLYAENKGKAPVKGYVFEENLSDVMDYADPTDISGGNINGEKVIVWPAVDIPAGSTATKTVSVMVKNPIPSTPTSTSDANHYDLEMTNVYGNTINIKVPPTPAKAVEVATTTTLPNTGPGTSLFMAASIVIIAGYFYGRSRLLARESAIAIKNVSQA
ncbi:MAG: hypothetical protein NVS1B10_01080 [Candidatus Saccharimonadales bacterium]